MNKDYLNRVTSGGICGDVSSIFAVSGDINHHMELRGCFGTFTKNFHSPKKCDVTVRMFPYVTEIEQLTAVTPFSMEEIIEYLENLKRIFPFEFKIDEGEEYLRGGYQYVVFSGNKNKCYHITYSMEGPHIAYMFLLTMQRFLYGMGDCNYLGIAFELKRRYEEFKKMNLFNVLSCVISTLYGHDRGGDMFYFNPQYFSYLWSSDRLRDHLLLKEEKSSKEGHYGQPGVADLYSCNVYCSDSRLRRYEGRYDNRYGGAANYLLEKNEKTLNEALEVIAANLRVLREYNGYTSDLAKKKDNAIARNESSTTSNFYEERLGSKEPLDSHGRPITGNKFDESRLDAK